MKVVGMEEDPFSHELRPRLVSVPHICWRLHHQQEEEEVGSKRR